MGYRSFIFGISIIIYLVNGSRRWWVLSEIFGYYHWKMEDEVYYIFINGEWVAVLEDTMWEPGDPIPDSMKEEE